MEEILNEYLKKQKKPVKINQIIQNLDIDDKYKDKLMDIIKKQVESYELIDTNSGYIRIEKTNYRKGRLVASSRNGQVYVDNFYIDKNGEEKYYEEVYDVDREKFNGAIDGDTVLINITDKKGKNAIIDEVISRNLNTVIGEVYKEGNTYYLEPIDPHKKNLVISFDEYDDLVVGEKVLVQLNDLVGNDFYTASVIKRLGHKDDPDLDIIIEAARNGFEIDFSTDSIKQLESIPNSVRDIDKIGRSDLTDKEIFTIDGDDTKDIDDAISLEISDNGNYILGVHIADPAYYIEEDSPLDKDAYSRGTSVYAANTVIPMLPHKLSNGICSLNPNVERLTQSCVMEIDKEGNIVNYNIFRSVIKSRIKMTYKKVNDILKGNKIPNDYIEHVDTLLKMQELSNILRTKAEKNGCLNIDIADMKIKTNKNGKIVGIEAREKDLAEDLIEQFMVTANEIICKHLVSNFLPSVNRIHEDPSEEKIISFLKLLKLTGTPYSLENIDVTDHKVIQGISKFISKIEDNSMQKLQFLKSLKRARYSSVDLGHSGLSKEYYCHFTSPMRRYPDLIQNRILNDFLYNENTNSKKELISKWKHKLPDIAQHSSRKEKYADFCEKDVFHMQCCEYMKKYIGKEFEGTIVDIDANTIIVQLDNMIEGRIRPRNFVSSCYYSDKLKSFISKTGSDSYCLGDRLKLQLVDTNKDKKTIDFKILEKLTNNVKLEKECKKEKIKRNKMYYNSNRGVRR